MSTPGPCPQSIQEAEEWVGQVSRVLGFNNTIIVFYLRARGRCGCIYDHDFNIIHLHLLVCLQQNIILYLSPKPPPNCQPLLFFICGFQLLSFGSYCDTRQQTCPTIVNWQGGSGCCRWWRRWWGGRWSRSSVWAALREDKAWLTVSIKSSIQETRETGRSLPFNDSLRDIPGR